MLIKKVIHHKNIKHKIETLIPPGTSKVINEIKFRNQDETSMPDIDLDFADPTSIKDHFTEKWGSNTVAAISNFNTLQLKSLIKDISRFYDIPFQVVNKTTSVMMREATPLAKKKHGITAGVYVPTFEEVMEFSESLKGFLKNYPQVKDHIEALFGQTKSISRHAGGVVISPDLDKRMPLINSGGTVQTPWSEGNRIRHLEPMGFIKFDILGLASLRMIDVAVRHILKRHHNIKKPVFQDVRNYWNEILHPEVIDFNNQEVYENIFHQGKWVGIFQFTEKGAQQFCVQAKPKSLLDIAALTSIYRPGPMSAKVPEQYVAVKENPENIKYEHPILEEVLGDTYGFIVFQEQLALLAHKLGDNISLDEGNMLRKVLTKRGTGKAEQTKKKLYEKFVKGCCDKGLKAIQADDLWEKMVFFSGYGFNKSHAVCYSILSFQCAWLFNYYPAEWCAAFLEKCSE